MALQAVVVFVFAAGVAESLIYPAPEGLSAVEALYYVLGLLILFLLNTQLRKITVQFRKILPQTN